MFVARMDKPTRLLASRFAAADIGRSKNWRSHWLMSKILHKVKQLVTKIVWQFDSTVWYFDFTELAFTSSSLSYLRQFAAV